MSCDNVSKAPLRGELTWKRNLQTQALSAVPFVFIKPAAVWVLYIHIHKNIKRLEVHRPGSELWTVVSESSKEKHRVAKSQLSEKRSMQRRLKLNLKAFHPKYVKTFLVNWLLNHLVRCVGNGPTPWTSLLRTVENKRQREGVSPCYQYLDSWLKNSLKSCYISSHINRLTSCTLNKNTGWPKSQLPERK
jgi:hypothetical protein